MRGAVRRIAFERGEVQLLRGLELSEDFLSIAGVIAAWRPARRAATVDPIAALRAD